QKQVVDLLEWAGLEVPRTPMKQLNQREKDKATSVFVPKVRKQRVSALDRDPAHRKSRVTGEQTRPAGQDVDKKTSLNKPVARKPANRRIRQTSDLPQDLKRADRQKQGLQHKSDRNRGRG
ncbi:MAG TPA: 23S rRNA pseudouridylate synthase B, partial [Methylotenera sp.]|nr:23S rRNA pseudouridylate synthase B [Methylotenera sp.]